MVRPNNYSLVEITKQKTNQYVLVFEMDGRREEVIARVSMETPIFGVNFSDEFTLLMRNLPQETQQLVKAIKSYHFDSKVNLPIIFASEPKFPELKVA